MAVVVEPHLSYKCEQHAHGPCLSPTCECICHTDGRYCRKGWCEHCPTDGRKCICPCHKKGR